MTAAHRLSGDQDISPATSPGGTAMLMARFSRCVPVPQEARTAAIASTANVAPEPRVTQLERGTADTTSETRSRVHHSGPWSWSITGDGLRVHPVPSVVS